VALAALLALLLAGCSSKKTPPAGASAAANIGHLACFAGVKSYRFNGHLALDLGSSSTRSQLGTLSNLLQDVNFDGAYHSPDASNLNVHFPQSAAAQDLQTIKIGGKTYQKTGSGSWQDTPGSGPILSALNEIDPRTLCDQTLAKIDTSGVTPVDETVNGVAAKHYTFGPAELARSGGLFGGERDATATPRASTTPPDAHLDVWTSAKDGRPIRIALKSAFGEAGGTTTLDVTMDVTDLNGADVSIKAPL
jgi:hypothetical protein